MILLLLIFSILAPAISNIEIQPAVQRQDITGGAAIIFGRPSDPQINGPTPGTQSQRANENRVKTSDLKTSNDSVTAVEDALELGNSARNANPPRYRDAEIAYRLAAKLRPKDPRPLIGLGNIWYDQKQYAAAATMYQQALSMLSMGSAAAGTTRGEMISAQQRRKAAPLHAYIGTTMLLTENFTRAEVEFDKAIAGDSENARWRALKGYSLLKLGKPVGARKEFEEALRLEPGNADYQKLLESAITQAP